MTETTDKDRGAIRGAGLASHALALLLTLVGLIVAVTSISVDSEGLREVAVMVLGAALVTGIIGAWLMTVGSREQR